MSRLILSVRAIVLLAVFLNWSPGAAFSQSLLLNAHFASYDVVKTGFAATGLTTNDFWNGLSFPFNDSFAVSGLKRSDGVTTGVGLTVQNGGAHTGFSHPDVMYRYCLYAQSFGGIPATITTTVTNVANGQYDLYLYGHSGADDANTRFQVQVGGVDFGSQSTTTNSNWSSTNWTEGVQYVVYRGINLTNGAPLVILCHAGVSGYAYFNGFQLKAANAGGGQAPQIVSHPTNRTVNAGGSVSFSVTATGTAPRRYQWQHEGTNLIGRTAATLSLQGVQPVNAGRYSVIVSNAFGIAISSNAVLTVNTFAPEIVLQPTNRTVTAGGPTTTFAVSATGTATLRYQWRHEGTNLLGKTTSTLSLRNVQPSAAGNYSVVVSNAYGVAVSSNALLTVTPLPDPVLADLLNVHFASYDMVKTGFAATGLTGNDFWNGLSFPFNESFAVSGLKRSDGVTTGIGLTVQNGAGHTGLSGHPDVMYTYCLYARDFGTVTNTVSNVANGQYDLYLYGHSGANAANTRFQVQVGGVDFGSQSTTTNSDWISTNWTEGVQYVVYRGINLTNGGAPLVILCHPGVSGYTYFNGFQLKASAGSGQAPEIVFQPTNRTVTAGAIASFSVGAIGSPELRYQWRHAGTNLVGQTGSTLSLVNVQAIDAGDYSVAVSNVFGAVVSSNAFLTVTPFIPTNPVPATLLNVNFASYDVVKTGFAATGLTANDVWNGLSFPFNNSFVVSGLKGSDGVTTGVGLTVQNGAGHTGLSGHPDVMYTYCLYAQDFGTVTNTVSNVANGQYDLYLYGHSGADAANTRFQVQVGGVDFGSQSTTTNSNWISTNWTEGVQYVVYRGINLTNDGAPLVILCHPGVSGYTYFNGFQLKAASAGSGQAPEIVFQPTNRTVTAGAIASFSVGAIGSPELRYQWRREGTNLVGQTGSTLSLVNVQAIDAGYYSVVVSNNAGYALSSNALLTVQPVIPTNPIPADLLNVHFGSYDVVKTGFAATGLATNDFWNGLSFPFNDFFGVGGLKRSDGVTTGVGLTVQNGGGHTGLSGHPDVMYTYCLYARDFGTTTVTVSNMTTGLYDLYLYGHAGANDANTRFQVLVGNNDFGSQSTTTNSDWISPTWTEGVQYVVYRGIVLTNEGSPLVIKCHPGASGYTYLNGFQLKAANAGGGQAPQIVSHPTNRTVTAGSASEFVVSATGSAPLLYQWRHEGTNLVGRTTATLALNNLQAINAGNYSVLVSNQFGATISSNALLTVNPVIPQDPVFTTLLNVNFASYDVVKTGFAATGLAGNDFWNGLSFPFNNSFAVSGLKRSDGATTGVGLTVENGGGHTGFTGHPDVMYRYCLYAQGLGTITTTVTNVTTGPYDLYLYGHSGADNANTRFQVQVGGLDFGSQSTTTNSDWSSTNWTEGVQYVVYRGIVLTNEGSPLVIKCHPGDSGYTYFNGFQLKAAVPSAPEIVSQPVDRSVVAGAVTTFNVGVAGSTPMHYQWRHEGTNLPGATSASLVLSNVQLVAAGNYSVVVTNYLGSAVSSNAQLVVTAPPAQVRVVSVSAMAGESVELPVTLLANGNENALSFSLSFNTQRLAFASVSLGSGASGASLLPNTSQAGIGRVGIGVAFTTGETFAAGTQEVVRVAFTALPSGGSNQAGIELTSQPIGKLVADVSAQSLPATYHNGKVTLTPTGYEGDAAPRPEGNRSLDILDWVQVGRYAAGLDVISNANEFLRVDCAPRDTRGDGQIKVTDWVQAGRYATGLDPLTVAGGPNFGDLGPRPEVEAAGSASRVIQIGAGETVNGLNVSLPITLDSAGDENGVGFSLNFDPAVLRFVGVTKVGPAASANLNLNTTAASAGRVGLVLALPTGSTFPAGNAEILRVNFTAQTLTKGNYAVTLGDAPAWRAVSDAAAKELEVSFVGAQVLVHPSPTLNLTSTGDDVVLSWPAWAAGFNLQMSEAPASSQGWTNAPATIATNGANVSVTLPRSAAPKYFRLFHP